MVEHRMGRDTVVVLFWLISVSRATVLMPDFLGTPTGATGTISSILHYLSAMAPTRRVWRLLI